MVDGLRTLARLETELFKRRNKTRAAKVVDEWSLVR